MSRHATIAEALAEQAATESAQLENIGAFTGKVFAADVARDIAISEIRAARFNGELSAPEAAAARVQVLEEHLERTRAAVAEFFPEAPHSYVRPGQVHPNMAPPDQCVTCGAPEAKHA